jgi:hypothetical protein
VIDSEPETQAAGSLHCCYCGQSIDPLNGFWADSDGFYACPDKQELHKPVLAGQCMVMHNE